MLRITPTTTEVWFHLTSNERGVTAEKGRKGQKVVVSLDLFLLWMKGSPSETNLRAKLFRDGRIEPLTQQDVDEINLNRLDMTNVSFAAVANGGVE